MPIKDKAARSRYGRTYYAKNQEAKKAYARAYYLNHREQAKRASAAYRAARRVELNNRERARYYTVRDSILFCKYGLREKDVAEIITRQGGGCAICGGTHLLGVDHDHETKAVRGVLCRKCNSGIGQLRDDPALVQRAADYLNGKFWSTGD